MPRPLAVSSYLTLEAPRPALYLTIPWCSSALRYFYEGRSDFTALSLRVCGIDSRGGTYVPDNSYFFVRLDHLEC